MITEYYVSFETAKLLKEKGFDWECEVRRYYPENPIDECDPNGIYAPTLQTVRKWLEEKHNLFITIEIKGDPRKEDFIYYKWSVAKFSVVQIIRIDNGLNTPEDYWLAPEEEDEKPEYALEAAINWCLKNLI